MTALSNRCVLAVADVRKYNLISLSDGDTIEVQSLNEDQIAGLSTNRHTRAANISCRIYRGHHEGVRTSADTYRSAYATLAGVRL